MKTKIPTMPEIFWSIIATILFVMIISGCKDSGATHTAASESACNNYLNESEWDDAIETCSALKTDDGYHKAAQAYMGRAGVDLFTLMMELSGDSTDATELIFSKIPTTSSKRADYLAALYLIMGSVENKTDIMYLESLLLSGILVMSELKDLLDLELNNGTFTTCADPTGDIAYCSDSFTIDATTDPSALISFSGLGTTFYDNLCGDSGVDHDTVTEPSPFVRDVYVNKCTIQTLSVLNSNKVAFEGYSAVGAASVISSIAPLDFYSKMDTGKNFNKAFDSTPNSIFFCWDATHDVLLPDEPAADDGKLNDCEILGFLENPGF